MKQLLTILITTWILILSCEKEELTPKHLGVYDISPNTSEVEIRNHLVNVEKIGQLRIFNHDELVDLRLFQDLKSIDQLILSGCDKIESLNGMQSVEINKRLIIIDCDNLTVIEGLGQLDTIKQIGISNCKSLEKINLNKLVVADEITIDQSPRLETIEMINLELLKKEMNIANCLGLNELKMNKLKKVEGLLGFQSNASIEQFEYLTSLRSVDHLLIRGNQSLFNIDGFESLNEINTIEMWGNQIDDFCVLKGAILSNPDIEISIQGRSIYNVDIDYFHNCE